MMDEANFEDMYRKELWAESANTAIKLENLVVNHTVETNPHKIFFGEIQIHQTFLGFWKGKNNE